MNSVLNIRSRSREKSANSHEPIPKKPDDFLKIRWLGHAGFRISFSDPKSHEERVVYIDPWLENPLLPDDLKGKPVMTDADLVLVTHGHFDHATSAPHIVKASVKPGAKTLSNFEISNHYHRECGLPLDKVEKMNKGGTIDFGFC